MIDLAKLDVVPYPHPALRRVAKEVPEVTPLVQDVVKRMIELMHEYKGIGLAATQIAVPWRIFVTFVNDKELVFINPKVFHGRNKKDKNPKISEEAEGCLSLPGLNVDVPIKRSRDVYVEALDINGKSFTISGPGRLARVIQHENDHLNGVLFTDHLPADMPEEIKAYMDGWFIYFDVQYEYLVKYANPKYGTEEQEKQKLLDLESLLQEVNVT